MIRAVAEQGPVLPLQLATIYASDEHVREVLRQRHAELSDALRTVSGRCEWGVKAYTNTESDDVSRGPADSGIAYVRRRRAQLSARTDALQQAGRQAQAVHEALASLAVASRTHAPRNTALDKRSGRQALRRIDVGDLSDDQIEHIGTTLMLLDARMTELCDHFGVSHADLNLDLGPLGPLLAQD